MIRMQYLAFDAIRDEAKHRLIDVREQAEYDEVHVHGVELFPLSHLQQGHLPDRDERQIVLICRSGVRSAIAGQYLEAQGFGETINIEDGTLGAIRAGDAHVHIP